jgi:hypothetical protein
MLGSVSVTSQRKNLTTITFGFPNLPLRDWSRLWKHLVFVKSPEQMIRIITFLTPKMKAIPRLFSFF